MKDMTINPFTKFDQEWALVSAGSKEKFNSMTISWGSMGTIWFKPVVTIYIRPDRYTYEFLKENNTFTVSFYGQEHRKALQIMGSISGKDTDKVTLSGLTPKFLESGVTYKEAKETLVCRKIYMQQMDMNSFPQEAFQYYEPGAEAHYMIIGEVL